MIGHTTFGGGWWECGLFAHQEPASHSNYFLWTRDVLPCPSKYREQCAESGLLDFGTINVLSQAVVWGCLGIFSNTPGFYALHTNSIPHF